MDGVADAVDAGVVSYKAVVVERVDNNLAGEGQEVPFVAVVAGHERTFVVVTDDHEVASVVGLVGGHEENIVAVDDHVEEIAGLVRDEENIVVVDVVASFEGGVHEPNEEEVDGRKQAEEDTCVE